MRWFEIAYLRLQKAARGLAGLRIAAKGLHTQQGIKHPEPVFNPVAGWLVATISMTIKTETGIAISRGRQPLKWIGDEG